MEGLGGAGWRWWPQPPETRPRVGSLPGGNAPAPKPQARETLLSRAKQDRVRSEARGASSDRGKRVSRAWSGARSGLQKARGALAFRDTGRVQTPELPAGRPDREKAMLAPSRIAAVRTPCSPPAVLGGEWGAGSYTGYLHHAEITYGEQ